MCSLKCGKIGWAKRWKVVACISAFSGSLLAEVFTAVFPARLLSKCSIPLGTETKQYKHKHRTVSSEDVQWCERWSETSAGDISMEAETAAKEELQVGRIPELTCAKNWAGSQQVYAVVPFCCMDVFRSKWTQPEAAQGFKGGGYRRAHEHSGCTHPCPSVLLFTCLCSFSWEIFRIGLVPWNSTPESEIFFLQQFNSSLSQGKNNLKTYGIENPMPIWQCQPQLWEAWTAPSIPIMVQWMQWLCIILAVEQIILLQHSDWHFLLHFLYHLLLHPLWCAGPSKEGNRALCPPMAVGSLGHHAELMIKVAPGPCAVAAFLSGGWSASDNSCSTGGSSSHGFLPHFHQFLKHWGLSAPSHSCLHLDAGTRSQELKSISWRLNLLLIFFVCIHWCIWIIEEKPKWFIKR